MFGKKDIYYVSFGFRWIDKSFFGENLNLVWLMSVKYCENALHLILEEFFYGRDKLVNRGFRFL
jgi:hypothetical protein